MNQLINKYWLSVSLRCWDGFKEYETQLCHRGAEETPARETFGEGKKGCVPLTCLV